MTFVLVFVNTCFGLPPLNFTHILILFHLLFIASTLQPPFLSTSLDLGSTHLIVLVTVATVVTLIANEQNALDTHTHTHTHVRAFRGIPFLCSLFCVRLELTTLQVDDTRVRPCDFARARPAPSRAPPAPSPPRRAPYKPHSEAPNECDESSPYGDEQNGRGWVGM